ncbi:MAG: hypothetical protein DRO98_01270 [Archaeoglobales archaeon]|nr:MAG: hypothetical protein DRO98_01270 [Archaeoglobales archaeon]
MTLGVVVYYLGISIYITSPSSVPLTSAFLLLSTAYIKLVEEKELEEVWRRIQEKCSFLVYA